MSDFQPPFGCEERSHPHHVSTICTGLVAFGGSAPVEFVRAALLDARRAWMETLKEGAA